MIESDGFSHQIETLWPVGNLKTVESNFRIIRAERNASHSRIAFLSEFHVSLPFLLFLPSIVSAFELVINRKTITSANHNTSILHSS